MICPHYGICGGCKLYPLSYDEQLIAKTELVEKTLQKFSVPILPIIPAPQPFHYRNKIEMTFFNRDDKSVGIGFHEKGQFNRFVDVTNCLLTPERNNDIVSHIRDWANNLKLDAYNKKPERGVKRGGLLRYLIIRDSFAHGKKLIILVTNGGQAVFFQSLAKELPAKFPVAGFIWSNQTDPADAVLLQDWEVIMGDDHLMDTIGTLHYKVPLNSFFQVNTAAAHILYDLIAEKIQPGDQVLDLYCGAGTISCYIAGIAKTVFGIESVESAITSAYVNAKLNNLANLEFTAGRVRERLANMYFIGSGENQRLHLDAPHFDTIILDPPRSGTDKKTMARIAAMQPRQVIYVACGYAELAYNLRTLVEAGYQFDSVQPLDMFPNTPHVETVISLIKA